MKTALLFKALGDCPDVLETPETLVAHATKHKNKEARQHKSRKTLETLFALQEAV